MSHHVTITWKDNSTESVDCDFAQVMMGTLILAKNQQAYMGLSEHRYIPLDRIHECTIRTDR